MDPSHAPGIDGQSAEAHSSKPDPNEPWRYVCPKCGGQPSGNTVNSFTCTPCGETFGPDELIDLKRQ